MCNVEKEHITLAKANELVINAHESLCKDYPTIRYYKVEKLKAIEGKVGRGNGRL